MRALIVDDVESGLYLLRSLLQGHGFTVDEASNGASALAKAQDALPDVVISDLPMPGMDGYALLRHWKADGLLKAIPFVVYTAAHTDPRGERLALDLGADAFILKPCEPKPFMERLSEVLAAAGKRGLVPAVPKPGEVAPPEAAEALIRKLESKVAALESANSKLRDEMAAKTRAEEMLRQSEERFRELAETIQEAFWITDPERKRTLYISPAYAKIWGRSSDSLYLAPGSWLDSVHAEDRERVRDAIGAKQARGDYDEVYRIRRPDNAVRWIRDRAYPVHDKAGAVVRIVGTVEDVTDRLRLEEQYRQAQKLEAIGRLAAGVAHDFNNILAVILGNAELIETKGVRGRPIGDSLEEIKKASGRGKSLVQQILTYSRQRPPEREIIELGPIVAETVNFMRAVIPAAIELSLTADPSAPAVLVDPTQIHQVIANLCANAWHSLEGNSGRIRISLQALTLDHAAAGRLSGIKPGRVALLSVSDDGKGMDDATLERIFDPFFTTKGAGKGTGLGLSVVQGIVQGHDGAIAVASRPGRGTTFQVYFPAAPLPAAEPVPMAAPLRGHGERILYLDDEESLVALAVDILGELGYRVSGFTTAADALEAFRENPTAFDLLITDLNMPGPSGLEIAGDLLRMRPSLPILLCSGHVTEDLKQRAVAVGIREVLYKPNTLKEFGEAIHRVISEALQGRPRVPF